MPGYGVFSRNWEVRSMDESRTEMSCKDDGLGEHKRRFDLKTMLEQIRPENIHAEIDFGPAQGKEES